MQHKTSDLISGDLILPSAPGCIAKQQAYFELTHSCDSIFADRPERRAFYAVCGWQLMRPCGFDERDELDTTR
jgi:hypothetical protein